MFQINNCLGLKDSTKNIILTCKMILAEMHIKYTKHKSIII